VQVEGHATDLQRVVRDGGPVLRLENGTHVVLEDEDAVEARDEVEVRQACQSRNNLHVDDAVDQDHYVRRRKQDKVHHLFRRRADGDFASRQLYCGRGISGRQNIDGIRHGRQR
jgi:hypothetical protein